MRTTSLSRIVVTYQSGNHGGSQSAVANVTNIMVSSVPTQSQKAFVAPDAILKKSPSIKELIHDPAPKSDGNDVQKGLEVEANALSETAEHVTPVTETQIHDVVETETAAETAPQETSEPQPQVEKAAAQTEKPAATEQTETMIEEPLTTAEEVSPQTTKIDTSSEKDDITKNTTQAYSPTEQPTSISTPVQPSKEQEQQDQFLTSWLNMVNLVYSDVPTIFSTLKNIKPTQTNNIIYFSLKNDLQIEDFNIKKIEALRILRGDDNNINDIVVTIDTTDNTKKYIIDDADKITELKKQNADFGEFLKELDLNIRN